MHRMQQPGPANAPCSCPLTYFHALSFFSFTLCCRVINIWDQMYTQDDIIKDLEQPTISTKINGIKQAILLLLSGETLPR